MESYEHKTKEELLDIIRKLERKVDGLTSELTSLKQGRFRERYGMRILDALPDMLTVFDHDANIVELASSPSTNHVEGTTADSIVDSNVRDIVPEEAYESVRHNMDKVIHTGKSSAAEHSLVVDGIVHYYENRIFPLDDEYLLCMCRDVSQERQMAETNEKQRSEIVRLNSLMDAIINNVPVYLFVKDTGNDFRYLYWNKAFADHSGIPVEKVIGCTDEEIFPNSEDAERFRRDDLLVLKEGRIEYQESYTTVKGDVRMVNTVKTLVSTGDEPPYIIGVSWDVTDMKNTENELIEARIKAEESDRLKSSFLANMSHEIRTPLNAIVGFSKLVIEDKDEENQKQYADIVERNSSLLLNLFNDILDLSALEAGTLQFTTQTVKLNVVFVQAFENFLRAPQKGVTLLLDEINVRQTVIGNRERISQVLVNLLTNAIKFTPNGEIHLGYQVKGDVVECYVKDTGIGISAEKAAAIFHRFSKVNDFVQGTGLGLTICRMLVEKMGGRIWVRSKVGSGSAFYFTLPCAG